MCVYVFDFCANIIKKTGQKTGNKTNHICKHKNKQINRINFEKKPQDMTYVL
jgi:hypothetical protein